MSKLDTTLKADEAAALKAAVEAPDNEPATVTPNTDLDIIDVEVEGEFIDGPAPYTTARAEALDKRIVATVTNIGTSLEKLEKLVAEARDGQIHLALGFDSWTAYFADRMNVRFTDIGERQKAVLMLHEAGMSNRTIAAATGVSPGTVSTDVNTAKANQPESERKEPTPAVGKDNKTYPRKPKKPAAPAKSKTEPAPEKPKTQMEQLLDMAFADAENVVADLETLITTLGKVYAKPNYKRGMDKEIRAQITKARKLIGELPKAPAVQKGA